MLLGARQSLFGKFSSNWPYTNGTNILITISTDNKSYTISNLVKDSTSTSVIIDWGDGNKNTYTSSSFSATHTYIKQGYYVIYVSDDISSLKWQSSTSENTIYAMYSFGTKLLTLQGQCFQRCGVAIHNLSETDQIKYFNWMKNKFKNNIVNIYFSSMGSYACDCFKCSNLRFVNMTSITGVMFYAGGLNHVQNLYFSKCNSIAGDYLHDWSNFFPGYNIYDYKSITFEDKTCAQIKAMSNFPWQATASDVTIPVYFHGTDGTMDKNGNIIS